MNVILLSTFIINQYKQQSNRENKLNKLKKKRVHFGVYRQPSRWFVSQIICGGVKDIKRSG